MDIRTAVSRNKVLLLCIGFAVAIAVGAWWLWGRGDAANAYRTAPAKVGDITLTVSANGTLNPVVLVNVGTQVSGTVQKLHVDFNDHVKAGQVLLELDPALLRAQVQQDEANVVNARALLQLTQANEGRSLVLWDQDSIAKEAVDTAVEARKSAQAQVDLALAQLAKDKTNLDYSVIKSPVAGVVVNRAVDLGQTVAASFQTPTLFQIAQDLGKMQIDSSFAEADVGRIKAGQPVQFTVDAFPNRQFSAKVKQVRLNPTTQQNVVTYDVVVAVENPELILMPGMTAYVNVIVDKHLNALSVPNAALRFKPAEGTQDIARPKPGEARTQGAAGTVYTLTNGRVQAIKVTLGISDGQYTEVVSGALKSGDQLVTGIATAAAEQTPSTLRGRLF